MKRFLLFMLAALAFAACTQNVVVEITPAPIVDEAPETLVVGFEGDDGIMATLFRFSIAPMLTRSGNIQERQVAALRSLRE